MPPKKQKIDPNIKKEAIKSEIVKWFVGRKPEPMTVIEVAIQNDWTADKSLKPGAKFKDCLKELIEEGRVSQRKCGLSTVFYSFPATELNNTMKQIQSLVSQLQQTSQQYNTKEILYNELTIGREDTPQRQSLLRQREQLLAQNNELQLQIDEYQDNDPQFIAELEHRIQNAYESINIWTENIFLLLRFYSRLGRFQNDSIEEFLDYHKVDHNIDYILPPSLADYLQSLSSMDDIDQTDMNIPHDKLLQQRPKSLILPEFSTSIPLSLFAPITEQIFTEPIYKHKPKPIPIVTTASPSSSDTTTTTSTMNNAMTHLVDNSSTSTIDIENNSSIMNTKPILPTQQIDPNQKPPPKRIIKKVILVKKKKVVDEAQ